MARHLFEQVPDRGKRHATAAAASKIQDHGTVDQLPLTEARLSSPKESDDYYHTVIFQIDDWRVIVCRDGIQWIIQRRRRAGRRRVEWKGRSYHTTRDVLIRDWRRHTGDAGTFLVASVPERIGRQR
ncbi:MAG: hypothetical protein ACU0DX_00230 [Roseovarius sp.]|uniref:hypothetical protein n=1 Tax=Roseovarius sp. TaxID=1486281 RepID=UPI0040592934